MTTICFMTRYKIMASGITELHLEGTSGDCLVKHLKLSLKQAQLKEVAGGQLGFECVQGWRLCSLSGCVIGEHRPGHRIPGVSHHC